MMLNIFALTITITKREISLEQALHNENAKKIFEENRRKVESYIRIRQY
ncbi:YrzI family small protein [Lysinibacillus fusiformis]|nr:YrzI family small protein [Lysinibacillus fusiformis]MBD8520502.1 YrzI family small protein [Lysinibacillus fusiformis]